MPETEVERRIMTDQEWQEGAAWGTPRPGHPEGAVAAHIAEVLANVDQVALDASDRARLRLVALVHDTFKYRVNRSRPRSGTNHHAMLARQFAERYLDDPELLEIIELHDEAYNAWSKGRRTRNWRRAEARAERLLGRLESAKTIAFYQRFYQADNATGGKDPAPLRWFSELVERRAG